MRILDFGFRISEYLAGAANRGFRGHFPWRAEYKVSRTGGVCALLLLPLAAFAFPPAPHHEIYGIVRDQWGNPFAGGDVTITLVTDNGIRVTSTIVPGLEPGVNYRLRVPMDAAITPDLYRPNALMPLVPFRIQVRAGGATYLPIQMQGDYALLGQPAERTRIDLTIGTDSDGDGLPDAWKDMVIAMLGGGLTRADIRPHDDLDGDGMTNLQEYIAGTYPWDPNDNLWLDIIEVREEEIVLEFFAIDGRSYRIWGSTDLREWSPVQFHLPQIDEEGTIRASYFAPDARRLSVDVAKEELPGPAGYFRLQVQ